MPLLQTRKMTETKLNPKMMEMKIVLPQIMRESIVHQKYCPVKEVIIVT